jgi:hypothetical protein
MNFAAPAMSPIGPKRSIQGGLILTEARCWGLGNVAPSNVKTSVQRY